MSNLIVEGQSIDLNKCEECFAIRGKTMIDLIDSRTGRTLIYKRTLEECRAEKGYDAVERMTVDEYLRDKAAAQDEPYCWKDTTEEYYYEMLEVLPPAYMSKWGFMVGEPWDHHAISGKPRYQAFRQRGDRYEVASRPLTIKEFLEHAR